MGDSSEKGETTAWFRPKKENTNGAEVKSGFRNEARHKRSGDRRSGLRLRSNRSESHLKAKLFELMDETFFFALTLELIKIVRAKFLIFLGVSDDMGDNN
jgi:hypothetical protein